MLEFDDMFESDEDMDDAADEEDPFDGMSWGMVFEHLWEDVDEDDYWDWVAATGIEDGEDAQMVIDAVFGEDNEAFQEWLEEFGG